MEIATHFQEVPNDNFIVFLLKDSEWSNLLEKLPTNYKDCFISENELITRMVEFGTTREQELIEKIPSEWKIKAWDFWEILAYYFFNEKYSWDNLHWPKKWRWKESKDTPAPYSDVVFFKPINSVPAEDDILISIESKVKSTYSSSYSPIQNAIDWAKKDHISRLAKSLPWLKEKYKQELIKDPDNAHLYRNLVNSLNRYIESETYWKYIKYVKAIAFIDTDFLTWETDKPITLPTPVIEWLEVYVIWINNLKDLYENTYSKITTLW